MSNTNDNKSDFNTKVFSDDVFDNLPEILKNSISGSNSKQERDMMLLGALTTISAGLPGIHGYYGKSRIYPNLYLFVNAPASAGKGKLAKTKKIAYPIHLQKRDSSIKSDDKTSKSQVENNSLKIKKNVIKKTKEKMFFIPANNSSSGMFQLLSDNGGAGMIFETEGDTLTQAFKSDYGDYSDGFRKAFHHEPITFFRRTEQEYIEIEDPKLSVLLSGTPNQINSLIKNSENGLFSRFIYYSLELTQNWEDPYAFNSDEDIDSKFKQIGTDFLKFYNKLHDSPEIKIELSSNLQEKFNDYFTKIHMKYSNIETDDFVANIRRLGLSAFRIMMIFTALRIMEDDTVTDTRVCNDVDFNNTMLLITTLIEHSAKVYRTLPIHKIHTRQKTRKQRFIEELPYQFNRQEYLEIANKLEIKEKTADGYITKFVKNNLIHRDVHNKYINNLKEESK